MKKSIIAFAVVTILVWNVAYGLQETQRIEVLVDTAGNSLVKNLFFIDTTKRDQIMIPVYAPSNIKVFDYSGKVDYNTDNGLLTVIPRNRQKEYSLTAEYTSDFFTSKNNTLWSFSYLYTNLEGIDNVNIIVSLPKNAKISRFTEGGYVYSENGALNIEWSLQSPQAFTVEVEYTLSFQSSDTENNNNQFFLYIVLIISSGIILQAIYPKIRTLQRKKNKPKPRKKQEDKFSKRQQDIMRTLTENEKAIINALFEEKEMTQKKLGLKTGIPKSTLSRTLKKLEIKSLVESREYGTTKMISLAKWFREK